MHIPHKTLILGSALLFTAALTTRPAFAGRCNPNGICTACSNCSACKNCSQNGGSCSVCRGTSQAPTHHTQPRVNNPATSSARVQRLRSEGTVTLRNPSNANAIAAYTRQQQLEAQRQAAIRRQNRFA